MAASVQLTFKDRRQVCAKRTGIVSTCRDGPIEVLPVVEIIGQGGIDLSKIEVVFSADLIGTHSQLLMPHRDIPDLDPMARDMGFAAGNPRGHLNVRVQNLV